MSCNPIPLSTYWIRSGVSVKPLQIGVFQRLRCPEDGCASHPKIFARYPRGQQVLAAGDTSGPMKLTILHADLDAATGRLFSAVDRRIISQALMVARYIARKGFSRPLSFRCYHVGGVAFAPRSKHRTAFFREAGLSLDRSGGHSAWLLSVWMVEHDPFGRFIPLKS